MLTKKDIRIPRDWEIVGGADTGTFMGGCIAAIDPNYELYVLEEFPNYRYTGDGSIELIGMTVGEWFKAFGTAMRFWTKQAKNYAWVDANTTFKTEVSHGLRFKMNKKDLELRTEITREYNRNGRIHLMPWLSVIPYELEEAHFPETESAGTGKYRRLKEKDHCLDGLEHICSRRPHPDFENSTKREKTGIAKLIEDNTRQDHVRQGDPHLGQL